MLFKQKCSRNEECHGKCYGEVIAAHLISFLFLIRSPAFVTISSWIARVYYLLYLFIIVTNAPCYLLEIEEVEGCQLY